MNELHFGNRVKRTLNEGLSLNPAVLDRLRTAREAALERQRVEQPSYLWSWATQVGGPADGPRSLVSSLLLSALVLALGLFVVNYWHQAQTTQEIVEIDAAVLLGELPLDA